MVYEPGPEKQPTLKTRMLMLSLVEHLGRMAVKTCLATEKTCPTNIYAAFSPRSGGAVTMVSCYWQGYCPEPTQWGCGGGQVEALTSRGELRSGETEALLLCEGLGGETAAWMTTVSSHPCPSPRWSCGKKTKDILANQWEHADKNYAPYFAVSPLGPVKKRMTNYSIKLMTFITNLKEGDVSLA